MRTRQSVAKAHIQSMATIIWFDMRHGKLPNVKWLWHRLKLAVKCSREFA